MSYYPRTPEEIDQHFQDVFEVFRDLEQTPRGDFQQGSCIPQTAYDALFSGNQMVAPDGYRALDELQKKDGEDQINHYGRMPSCGPTSCQGGEQSHSRYELSAYRGDQDFWVHQEMPSPVGSQPLCDGLPQTPELDLVHHGGTSPPWTDEYNLFQCLDTTPS